MDGAGFSKSRRMPSNGLTGMGGAIPGVKRSGKLRSVAFRGICGFDQGIVCQRFEARRSDAESGVTVQRTVAGGTIAIVDFANGNPVPEHRLSE
jgi:hypothetical protein